jgi:putative membrane protein
MTPLPKAQGWMLAAVMLGIPLSASGALYPSNTWLQVGPVALALPFAWRLLSRAPISNASAACITAFVLLHLFAARWSYSFVPYDAWLPAMTTERNHFDRLVHFAFGVLAMAPMVEAGVRYWGLTPRMAPVFAILFVLAVGGLYEIFEWSLTLALAPEDAGAYNGEQGDMFDAQKDMALAGLGAVLTVPLMRRAGWWKGIAE